MVAVPADCADTTPEPFTVATAVLLLLHVPPKVAEAKVLVAPIQSVVVPVIGATDGGVTVTVKLPVLLLLLASVAVTFTVVTPIGNAVLGFLLYVIVTTPPVLSVAVAAKLTTAVQIPVVACAVIFEGTVSTGATLSMAIIVCVCVDVFPLRSS